MNFGAIVGFIQAVLSGAIRSGTSFFYAALGEVIVERAGIVNLGLEGCMLVGACAGFITASRTGNPYFGLVAAAIAGGLFNLLLGVMVITYRANQLASGLTLLFLAYGLTAIFGAYYVGKRINGLDTFSIPVLSDLPLVGPVLFQGDVLWFHHAADGPPGVVGDVSNALGTVTTNGW